MKVQELVAYLAQIRPDLDVVVWLGGSADGYVGKVETVQACRISEATEPETYECSPVLTSADNCNAVVLA